MLTGPEATIVTRAGGAVLRGVKQQATTPPEWPSLHASLMELHAIIDQWCDAADETARLIQMKLDDEISQPKRRRFRRKRSKRAYDFGGSVNTIYGNSNIGGVMDIHAHAVHHLRPKVSLAKRLAPEQRRQATRRNLQSLMRVYCPDLLSEFEEAADRRRAWVAANRSALLETLTAESVAHDSLRTWAEEARQTKDGLVMVRDELATLIREKFPMGHGPLGNQ